MKNFWRRIKLYKHYTSRLFTRSGFLRVRKKKGGLSKALPALLVIAALVCGFATYAAFTEAPPFGDNPELVIWLLNIDLIIVLLLVTLIARRLLGVWSNRKKDVAGSRLHIRLVLIFSLLTITPAIVMTIFSATFLQFGVQSWFNNQVRTAIMESRAVAEAYLQEHQQVIRADVLGMANDIDRQSSFLFGNTSALEKVLQTQSFLRNFAEAIIYDSEGRPLARSGLTFNLAFDDVPDYVLAQVKQGDVVVMTGEDDDRIRAFVELRGLGNAYLYVGRMVDPVVLGHLNDTREAYEKYALLESQQSDLQIKLTLIFVVVALLLLFAAIWFGLMFSRQLIVPLGALINATDRVRSGDLDARVPAFDRKDEFDVLARAFNRMTDQLQNQHNDLILANRQLDQRRRFTETVLTGVSSGVIGLDDKNIITLANSSANHLLKSAPEENLVGKRLTDILPEIQLPLENAHKKPAGKNTQTEIPLLQSDGSKRNLLVRIAIELIGEKETGAVITFDDITELQSAQRKAAWADVARRIAHEIKNPLTPIQLSAERLKRKYMVQIKEDRDIFAKCTDTIIHHVGDIGRMVNEFSSFARMPEPVMKKNNLTRHLLDLVIMQREAHPDIEIEIKKTFEGDAHILCDMQQIRQVFTNIIQNAIDSIQSSGPEKGKLLVLIAQKPGKLYLVFSDNGAGLPQNEQIERLTEPYVTHKEKGTGLGLAIVKKIMDDHDGDLIIGAESEAKAFKEWQHSGGATIALVFDLAESIETIDNTEDALETRQAI